MINRLRPKTTSVAGATLFLRAEQELQIGGRASNAQYQYTIQSANLQDLTTWGSRLLQEMKKLTGLLDVNTDQQNFGMQASLVYDRPTASRLGITPQLPDDTLYDAFGQRQVSTMYTPLNQYHVVMEVEPKFWQTAEGFKDIYIRPGSGGEVPLSCPKSKWWLNHSAFLPKWGGGKNLACKIGTGQNRTA
ncbi:efflux RND transporter permease subunit [Edaphobacter sp. HDX4]|uniref:efflux RND transporter permease subunit n=1 Tax=Edaphobacter sp. HDX4 TaxID=2794064 RepID=UPI002FE62A66